MGGGITLVPYLHGRLAFARHVRALCSARRYDCIAVDLPEPFAPDLPDAVDDLPAISLLLANRYGSPCYYLPVDPCDATIEALRQARQNRVRGALIGASTLYEPQPLPPLPDEYAIGEIGFEAYASLCIHALANRELSEQHEDTCRAVAHRIRALRLKHTTILALVHFRHFIRTVHWLTREESHNREVRPTEGVTVERFVVNPDHLYFALGELPFVAGKSEAERQNILATPIDPVDTIKDLFRETRDDYYDSRDDAIELSPSRLQAALTFLRNLTVMEARFTPSLFDVVAAAKGVGGNAYAVRILKSAKYYPYLPHETGAPYVSVGIDKVVIPGEPRARRAVNLFRDTALVWRSLSIKPDPSQLRKKKYRFAWNPSGMCSHVPEDRRIEAFNAHVRRKSLQMLTEDFVKTERFVTSVKDGIDIRETLRNWHTGGVFVKEIPPSRGAVDTVVIIFDDHNDDRYPHQGTWYAEHDQESTLTFYATDPFADMIGPGIARSTYGGLALLFPPRPIPNAFEMTHTLELPRLSHRLAVGAMMFSRERAVAYVAGSKPDLQLRIAARRQGKHLVWIPLASFSNETLRRLRSFHVLNGKVVRSWASRFIGD